MWKGSFCYISLHNLIFKKTLMIFLLKVQQKSKIYNGHVYIYVLFVKT